MRDQDNPEPRALSVRQPWAQLIVQGAKDVENRSRSTRHRGRLYIHAATRLACVPSARELLVKAHFPEGISDLPRGAVIGTVDLIGCYPHGPDCVICRVSPWASEHYTWHWVLAHPVQFDAPAPMLGQMGVWSSAALAELSGSRV